MKGSIEKIIKISGILTAIFVLCTIVSILLNLKTLFYILVIFASIPGIIFIFGIIERWTSQIESAQRSQFGVPENALYKTMLLSQYSNFANDFRKDPNFFEFSTFVSHHKVYCIKCNHILPSSELLQILSMDMFKNDFPQFSIRVTSQQVCTICGGNTIGVYYWK
jgi:hypothetical protein